MLCAVPHAPRGVDLVLDAELHSLWAHAQSHQAHTDEIVRIVSDGR